MSLEDSINSFQDFALKAMEINDLLEFANFFVQNFSSGQNFHSFLEKDKFNLIAKAYRHDYRNWVSHLKTLDDFGVGEDGICQEDELENNFYSFDFYKAAISFLAYLESDFNPVFNLSFNSRNLERLLDSKDSRIPVKLPKFLPSEMQFIHFYVIWNLVKNANQEISKIFTENPNQENSREIQIEFGLSPYMTGITVLDEGPGIPMPKLRKIFKEGFSSKSISTNEGFGLYGIKKIIDAIGGQIGVITRYEDYLYHFIDYPRYGNKKPKIWREKSKPSLVPENVNTLFHILLPNQ